MKLLSRLQTQNVEIGLTSVTNSGVNIQKLDSGDYHDLIFLSSPGLNDPNYVQPSAPANYEQKSEMKSKTPNENSNNRDIQEGSSNFINIRPKEEASNIYLDSPDATDQRTEGEEYESIEEQENENYEKDEAEVADSDFELDDEDFDDGNEEEYSDDEEEYEAEDDEEEDYEAENDEEEESDNDDDFEQNSDQVASKDDLNYDPLTLEKEDHVLDSESAKFDESKIKERAEKLVEQKKKLLDNKFLKELETPVKSKGYSSKQEEHSPFNYVGHRISHSKPFRSFKEYLEKSQNKVKVISNSLKSDDQDEDESFDTGDITSQKVAKNSPPTDPSRYNTDGTIEEDIVKGIPKKIKRKIKRLPNDVSEKAKKIKNKII